MPDSADSYIQRADGLFNSQHYINNQTISDDVASLFIPRRSEIQTQEKGKGTDAGWYDHIYDSAPIEAAQILAQGQYDLLFTGDWFETEAPQESLGEEDHDKEVAYSIVGKRMRKVIDKSNFKLEIQEFLADRSTMHTSLILVEEDEEDLIFHTHIPVGQYAIAENHKKQVDLFVRKFKLTARQAKEKFKKETDKLGAKVMEAVNNPAKQEEKFEFYHMVEPRIKGVKPGSDIPSEMSWASIYVCLDDKNLVREGGYQEQPFMCSRFNRWGDSPYGTGPSHIQLSRARSLQKKEQTLQALGNRVTSPGIIVGPGQEDDPDPFGVTVATLEDAAMGLPREWKYAGDYNVSRDMVDRDIRKLEDSFFVPLFKLLTSDSERQREKTAFETAKMLEEQVGRASPTFSRLDEEVIDLYLKRVFGIMLRTGEFNDIIQHLIVTDPESEQAGEIELPQLIFTSKLAMAMKAVRSNSFMQFLQTIALVVQVRPEVLDNTNWDLKYRNLWKDSGQPEEELFGAEDVAKAREAQAKAQQMQMALEMGKTGSEIEKNIR